MTTATDIYTTYHVTFEQVQACERIIDDVTRRAYYIVASASVPGQEYKVAYNPVRKVLECLPHNGAVCKASENGIGCWHKRASLAAAAEYREYRKAMQEKEQAAQVTTEVLGVELNPLAEDVQNERQAEKQERKAVKANGYNAYNRKPFSLLR